ncbi:ADP-ribosylglycohydrolase family protein [Nocardia asteroides]|uniref:ADP-ribosylglycohydrolase family protein n=1 Tax=Nocardia asteroides TaxID=1824 RepID=UPI001E50758F|nr:ADP-ribosylglycohydrolase family protein [Nocardia asteroides]UGT57454.1 ADP-ribosylglycohydrolase family protein [Nocardia asteroides]
MLRRGEVFAGFVIERELGRGGMGAVYAARDRRLPRLTALKLMHRDLFTDREVRARFEREADLVAQLDHPNIITVYDRGLDEDRLWIAMQFVDGVDASAVPAARFGAERIAQIVAQTASALDYAHRRGVLHRDVKPANILLSQTAGVGAGFDERVVLTDFGIAKLLDDTGGLTRTGQFTATIAYASPEQLTSSPLDHRCDQYSLACTVFRLLTGTGPFDAPNPATVMLGHLNAPPPPASARRDTLPPAVDAVLAKAMSKDPAHRFATCTDFATALTDALRRRSHPSTGGLPPRPDPPRTGAQPMTRTDTPPDDRRAHAGSPGPGPRSGSVSPRPDAQGSRGVAAHDLARRLDPTAPGPATPAEGRPRINTRHPDRHPDHGGVGNRPPIGDRLVPHRSGRHSETTASGPERPDSPDDGRPVPDRLGEQFSGASSASAAAAVGDQEPRNRNAPATAHPERQHRSSDAVPTAASVWLNAVRGCLLGGAVGDALGAPVEALSLRRIREVYGRDGVTDVDEPRISEETQLTAFTVEALIRGSVRARAKGIGGATMGLLQQGMLVWLRGQVVEVPEQPVTLFSSLSGHRELIEQRGVANSVYTALRQAAQRQAPTNPLGTRERPINNSKGSGAVMRAAPCGFGYAADRSGAATGTIFELGCDAAALTHGHPSGWLPAGTLSALIYRLARGNDTATALSHARTELARYPEHEETSTALAAATTLAARVEREQRTPTPEDVETLGAGWIGPEALAIAVFAVLAAENLGGAPHDIVRTGLLLSVNHSGDSDATGSLAGSLLGARYGHTALPRRWARTVDARPALDRLATDYCTEFGLTPPRDEHGQPTRDWFDRYPA